MMKSGEIQYAPVIALSGDEENKISILNSEGIFDEISKNFIIIVQKPITEIQLKKIINRLLLRKQKSNLNY